MIGSELWRADLLATEWASYRARTYSPSLGRFLQTDPIGYGAGMNLYAYVSNNPVNRNDPSGLCEGGWNFYWTHIEANYNRNGGLDIDRSRSFSVPIGQLCFTASFNFDFAGTGGPEEVGGAIPELAISSYCPVSAGSIDVYLRSKNSPMAGLGADLMTTGSRFDVDPRFLVSLAGAETGFGNNITWGARNAWNWGYGRPQSNSPFDSWQSGMTSVARIISNPLKYDLTNTTTLYLGTTGRSAYCHGSCGDGLRNLNTFMREQGGNSNSLRYPCRRR